jgi:hypothetical protein
MIYGSHEVMCMIFHIEKSKLPPDAKFYMNNHIGFFNIYLMK